MSVAVNCLTPFLPITSLQLQHFQAVTRSFAQRRPIISSVFNNFRTLSVATGGGTLSCRVLAASELAALRSPLFSRCYKLFLLFRTTRLARFPSFCLPLRSTQANERSRRCFSGGKMRNSHAALSPFN